MRTWLWLPFVGFLALLGGGALLARPMALSIAQSEAEARGLHLEVKQLSLGWFSARLQGASVHLEGVDALSIQLDEVHMDFGLLAPRLRRVEILGGRIDIEGSVSAVREQLQSFRARHASAPKKTGPSAAPQRTEVVRKLDVNWKGALGDGDHQYIEGLIAERGPHGQKVGADLISLQWGAIEVQVAGATVHARAGGFELEKISKAHAAEARVAYRADAANAAEAPGQSATKDDAPEDPASANPGAARAGAARAPPPEASGLKGLLEPHPERVARLRAALELIKTRVLPRMPKELTVERVWVTYRRGSDKLHVGPNRLVAENAPSGLSISVLPQGKAEGTPLSLTAHLPQDAREVLGRLELAGGPISLSTLGIQEGAFGLLEVARTTVQGELQASLDLSAAKLVAQGQVSVEGLRLDSPKLSQDIVAFPRLYAKGKAHAAVDGSSFEVSDAELTLGEARIESAWAVQKGSDHVALRARLSAPLLSCQALSQSAPRGLLGQVGDIRFDGTLSLHASVEADTRELSKMKVRWDFENGCRARKVPPSLDPERFRGLFRREVLGAGNLPMEVEFGPHSPHWTPYPDVSPHVESAILVSEDGRFYRHDGFDDRAMESAIAQNTRQGRFIRGASTVTMQLAKNLYLSRDKTVARKLQEAALTSLLEQSFSKRELLELYVNIVEFGPGVYGIRQAAQSYFGTTPARLSAAQAFFLISILPAPTLEYFEADGSLKESRKRYVRHLLEIAQQRGLLSEASLELALQEEPRLGQPDTLPLDRHGEPIQAESSAEQQGEHSLPNGLHHVPNPAALLPPGKPTQEPPASPAPPNNGARKKKKDQAPARTPVDPRRRGVHL